MTSIGQQPTVASRTEAVHLRILAPGNNWIRVGALIALGLTGYYSRLGPSSTTAVVSGETGPLILQGPELVSNGSYDIAITTPTWCGEMAAQGSGLFDARPLPIRLLAVLPHDDRLVLAVRADSGITSIPQLVAEQRPLRLSTPPLEWNHPASVVADRVLRAYGASLSDLVSWGGQILRDRPRRQLVELEEPVDPVFEAIFDEAIMSPRWTRIFNRYPMRLLDIDPVVVAELEAEGYRAATVEPGRLPGVNYRVNTIDFSGWAVICRADLPDDVAYHTVAAIDEQKEAIRGSFPAHNSPLTADIDLRAFDPGATSIPLHLGAAAYYSEIRPR
jgi:TRAP-type uncharacterized transport system substrate-binding protein